MDNIFYVYVIFSKLRRYIYVGLTNDFKRRFYEHQEGRNRKTRAYKPFELIHIEEFKSRIEARQREKYLKSGCGKEWIKATLIKARVAELVDAHV